MKFNRKITRKERVEATAAYLAKPHPPIELDRARFLICRCAEFDCRPHRAHTAELWKFNQEATGVFAQRKAPSGEPAENYFAKETYGLSTTNHRPSLA
jgi:hypothetical protein